jgi:hypothetical protein
MTPNHQHKRLSWLQIIAVCLAITVSSSVHAAKALLPTESEVRAGARLPIDGLYMVSGINKRVRLEGGRAVVVDGWKHLFVWDVEPGMVVISDIKHSGGVAFTGRDLPLQGDWRATFDKHKFTLAVVVNGAFGETKYEMTRVPDDTRPNPEPEIEPEEPAQVATVFARRVGDAKVMGCPGKQSYLSLGSCWTCPNNYRRASPTRAMDSPRACIKRGSLLGGPYKPAKRKDTAGRCPAGQFHVPEKGVNGCYRCPAGTKRIHIAGIDSLQCRT